MPTHTTPPRGGCVILIFRFLLETILYTPLVEVGCWRRGVCGSLPAPRRSPVKSPCWHQLNTRGTGRANGVKFGRKRKLSDYQRNEASKRRAAGETLTDIARSYGVAVSMISRL